MSPNLLAFPSILAQSVPYRGLVRTLIVETVFREKTEELRAMLQGQVWLIGMVLLGCTIEVTPPSICLEQCEALDAEMMTPPNEDDQMLGQLDAGMNAPDMMAICEAGTVRCEGTLIERCEGDAWRLESCPGRGEVCRNDVCVTPSCGDGVLDSGERCDDGNLADGDGCSALCDLESCGDGVLNEGEECDDGNEIETDACTTVCRLARCGDAIVKEGEEECDDGNGLSTDSCTNTCENARCGDGFIQPGELCDDGDLIDENFCTSTCEPARCGDGFVQPGEACDDQNTDEDDGCTQQCDRPTCGDGAQQAGETCDDGNDDPTDGCHLCRLPVCGDGIVQEGENCDDGNGLSNDLCTNACEIARCGDGFLQPSEACDDGNTLGGDTCSETCGVPNCGNGVLDDEEACDDGNVIPGDGCSAACDTEPGWQCSAGDSSVCRQVHPCERGSGGCPQHEYRLVEGGVFVMGNALEEAYFGLESAPEHAVTLPTFEMMTGEVTYAAYAQCVEAGVCRQPAKLHNGTDDVDWPLDSTPIDERYARLPVVNLTWNDAHAYAVWAGGRLPTEAEWEFAASSRGQERRYPWGAAPPQCDRVDAVIDGGPCHGQGTSVPCEGRLSTTAQGVCDLAGNVWEFTADHGFVDYSQTPDNGSAARVPLGSVSSWIIRGGGFRDVCDPTAPTCPPLLVTTRAALADGEGRIDVGFRVVRAVQP